MIPSQADMIIIVIMTITFWILTVSYNSHHLYNEQFAWLAESFLKGQLHISEPIERFIDLVYKDGKFFWHLPPLPAILLIPFVWFGQIFHAPIYQWYLNVPFGFGVFIVCYKIAKKFRFSRTDALYTAFAFVFASVYHQIAFIGWSWYLSQSITTFLIFLALYEYFTRKRWWFIGIIFAAILMTRPTAAIGVIFFIASILFGVHATRATETPPNHKKKYGHSYILRSVAKLVLPCILAFTLLLAYNQARFGNPWESGYALTNNFANPGTEMQKLFSSEYIPENFYSYFLKIPDLVLVKSIGIVNDFIIFVIPNIKVTHPGISFFIVSPIFLWLLHASWRKRLIQCAALPIIILLPLVLSFWGTGWNQIGPRYTLDFLPFAWIILLTAFPDAKLSRNAKIVIVVSAYFNFFLLATTFA